MISQTVKFNFICFQEQNLLQLIASSHTDLEILLSALLAKLCEVV